MILSIDRYDSRDGGGPMHTASSASSTWQRVAVGLGVDGDGGDAHPARRLDDAAGDLAAVGDQDLLNITSPHPNPLSARGRASHIWLLSCAAATPAPAQRERVG